MHGLGGGGVWEGGGSPCHGREIFEFQGMKIHVLMLFAAAAGPLQMYTHVQ